MKKIMILVVSVAVVVFVSSAYGVAPTNDMFANRIIISGDSGTVFGSNVGATLEPGENQPAGTGTVWWSWTATTSDLCEFNTCGSAFDTYIVIYTGDAVGSLIEIAENDDGDCDVQSKVCFEVTAGQTYQIQVSGYGSSDQGDVILSWKTGEPFGPWFLDSSFTSTNFKVWLATDLTALSYQYMDVENEYFQTNASGCKTWKYEYAVDYSDGFSIEDKKNNKKVNKKRLEGIGKEVYIEDYNGKQVLLYDWDSKKLITYKVKKDSFVKLGEKEIKDFEVAWFQGSEIYVMLENGIQQGLIVFDQNLKKEKWTEPLANGQIDVVGKGLTARKVWTNDNLKITCRKKGKKDVSEHNLVNPTEYEMDNKGGVLFWTKKNGTNSPVTYLDRNGKKVVDNQAMADVGSLWTFEKFDGKRLYVYKKIETNKYTVFAYKLNGMKKIGQQDIVLPHKGSISQYTSINKEAYIVSYYKNTNGDLVYAANIFDKNLKKERWKEGYANGSVKKIGKNSLYRYTYETVGDTTTKVYKLFNKKGEIVTYTYVYTQ